MNVIDKFDGEYEFLSNFYPCEISMDGLVFPSIEHAFQAAKTLNRYERLHFLFDVTAGQAKRMGKKLILREDWEDVKLSIMKNLVRQKFFENMSLSRKLVNTKDNYLMEGNEWNDMFWGVCNGFGENNLGKILMDVRSELCERYETF